MVLEKLGNSLKNTLTKIAKSICKPHILQIKNYMKASLINIGLIINFDKLPLEIKRIY